MLLNFVVNRIVIILCLVSTVARFALDSFLPSLPSIGRDFDISPDDAQLAITIYLFGFGCSQLFYGPLSDRYGRKKVLMAGLLVFIVGSLFSAMADSTTAFFFGRLIAGTGCGAAGVINRAIARDQYTGAIFAKVWSYTTTAVVFTLILAPVIGGYIQNYYDWRTNILAASLYVGIILLIIMLGLNETNKALNKYALKFSYMLTSYFDIISHRQFMGAVLCYTLTFAGLVVYFQVSPFLFMDDLNLSAIEYGWLSLIIASCYFFGGLLVKKFVTKVGVNRMLQIGIALLCISGCLALLTGLFEMQIWTILLPTVIYVVGARIIIPNALSYCLDGFGSQAGFASGLVGAIQMLGTAIISAIISQFDTKTQLPLAFCFITIGIASYVVYRNLFVTRLAVS